MEFDFYMLFGIVMLLAGAGALGYHLIQDRRFHHLLGSPVVRIKQRSMRFSILIGLVGIVAVTGIFLSLYQMALSGAQSASALLFHGIGLLLLFLTFYLEASVRVSPRGLVLRTSDFFLAWEDVQEIEWDRDVGQHKWGVTLRFMREGKPFNIRFYARRSRKEATAKLIEHMWNIARDKASTETPPSPREAELSQF